MIINCDILNSDNAAKADALALSASPCNAVIGASAASIAEQCLEGEDVLFVTNGAFSLHQLVVQLIERFGIINELVLSSFSFTEVPTRALGELVAHGKVKELHILVDVRARANYPGVFQQLKMIATSIAIVPVHAKVTVLISDTHSIAIMGSANWTTNKRYETGFITHNKEAVLFHKNWIITAIQNKIEYDNG